MSFAYRGKRSAPLSYGYDNGIHPCFYINGTRHMRLAFATAVYIPVTDHRSLSERMIWTNIGDNRSNGVGIIFDGDLSPQSKTIKSIYYYRYYYYQYRYRHLFMRNYVFVHRYFHNFFKRILLIAILLDNNSRSDDCLRQFFQLGHLMPGPA